MIVVDASALIPALVDDDECGERARALIGESASLHAPELLDLEVLSALRRLTATGRMTEKRAVRAVVNLLDLAVLRYSHHAFSWRIWELRHNLTPYDASYVALAEALACTLVTADRAVAGCPGLRCNVEYLRS
jgi:predicted nucleic acid-binding protein